MATRTAVSGRWVRLLLLLSTLLGLTAMHTLGHGGHASAGPPAAHAAGHGAAAVTPTDCGDDGCPVRALPLTHPGNDPSGWSVCLAVLGAFAVGLLLAVLLGAGSRSAVPTVRGRLRLATGPRAPPRSHGLRLATTSVLRR
ncbi:hypothetical protein GCE86_28465 [Micromonospora terminaliae]|uniref:Uncharacterized protein n=1 Tax=Micromonospora terminaliae TaxID=1914461 RepID=A0AAJ2ZCV5_9ACTN|nr:DUF6153 family protein [Micromonospora terminaliae]NES26438.1 hypothetical protein [Micromonospora terminaliae]QGL50614.1 hypothetical protein GCE86_28465 [Micromonospora terminaliae]